MGNLLAYLFGLISLVIVIPSTIPFLGWGNWLALPLIVIGVIFGALSSSDGGRNFSRGEDPLAGNHRLFSAAPVSASAFFLSSAIPLSSSSATEQDRRQKEFHPMSAKNHHRIEFDLRGTLIHGFCG